MHIAQYPVAVVRVTQVYKLEHVFRRHAILCEAKMKPSAMMGKKVGEGGGGAKAPTALSA